MTIRCSLSKGMGIVLERASFGKRIDVSPKGVKVENEPLAAGDGMLTLGCGDSDGVAATVQLVDGDDPHLGIDEPVEADAECGVLDELVDAIADLITGRRGENFNRDERRHGDEVCVTGKRGTSEEDGDVGLAAPRGGYDELGAAHEDPAGFLQPTVEGGSEPCSQGCMLESRFCFVRSMSIDVLPRRESSSAHSRKDSGAVYRVLPVAARREEVTCEAAGPAILTRDWLSPELRSWTAP